VNDVLDMSKIESGHLMVHEEPFDLEDLMKEVAVLMQGQLEETGIIHRKHRENMQHTMLKGDALQLQRIMMNLFGNAVKYNKKNGTIDTYVTEISCDGKNVLYEFRIADSGIGMSREYMEHELFQPFTQEKADARTQYKGTGLGMSIVKGLIDKMNGTISVRSTLGEGSEFTFRLTFCLAEEGAQQASDNMEERNDDLAEMRVLLVEDNDINMEIAEFYLAEAGIIVEKAWNGKEAVEKYEGTPKGYYSAILMDIMMPVMNGIEAARNIRRKEKNGGKEIPIIAMTAQSERESKESCSLAGMNAYISKPVDPENLIRILRMYQKR
jgi:CheY-like chemotaxis protein